MFKFNQQIYFYTDVLLPHINSSQSDLARLHLSASFTTLQAGYWCQGVIGQVKTVMSFQV